MPVLAVGELRRRAIHVACQFYMLRTCDAKRFLFNLLDDLVQFSSVASRDVLRFETELRRRAILVVASSRWLERAIFQRRAAI